MNVELDTYCAGFDDESVKKKFKFWKEKVKRSDFNYEKEKQTPLTSLLLLFFRLFFFWPTLFR